MSNASRKRKAHLDRLEAGLTGPKRVALFGHRAVGKTTLLAMFYREASTGRVPGARLAAVNAASAEYLAEKIARIEAGEPPAATLAETELKLRLYHGAGRLDLIVKDYQGEHVSLGADDRSIHAFFADCDAVLLCVDPAGDANPAERRRRQQEIEYLLERYIERSDDARTDRPVGLLVTKYDRVLARNGPPPDQVERLVESRFGMTRHVLATHAPRSALFAVSSYGRDAGDGDAPPPDLHPLGLEGPLLWLADQLEAVDRERLDWLRQLVPDDLPRLARCVEVFQRRYPKSGLVDRYLAELDLLRKRRRRRVLAKTAAVAFLAIGGLFAYDEWAYRRALEVERSEHSPRIVARRWGDLIAWHPTLSLFRPERAKLARSKFSEWDLRDAEIQLARGKEAPDLPERLEKAELQEPSLSPAARKIESARDRLHHDRLWANLSARSAVPGEDPARLLEDLRSFLRDYSRTPHRAEAVRLVFNLQKIVDERRTRAEADEIDGMRRAGDLPDADLRDLIAQTQNWLALHPDSPLRAQVLSLQNRFADRLDRDDIDKAREYSRAYPARFQNRIDRYRDYLAAHKNGGKFVREALEAQDRVREDWDVYAYRQAYDHWVAHPNDLAEIARGLREYLRLHPDGRFARVARDYLTWWEKVSTAGEYRVVLKRGEVEPTVGKYLAGGGPDLSVVVEVAGVVHGPSPIIPDSRAPNWNYAFPKPIRWKLGDPVTVRLIDNDWSPTEIYVLHSPQGDPLAIRLLSGSIKPAKGGKTTLVFSSDFQLPRLPKPD